MQFGRAVRAALIAAGAMMMATTVAPSVAQADHWHEHRGDLSWRCRHGDDYACRVLRDQGWHYYRGGGPYYNNYYYYDSHGHRHGWYYDTHGHRHHY